MGVPKFFRYISERYPCLSEFCLEDKIPQFDNLYLDMNGIIHTCSHPDDGNVHFRISEETMFRDIFKYIDKLFYLIKPQKLFFMAVDGVAPRAKMNQQRSRRFRSAKDAEMLEKNAEKRGEKLPDEARFDSNCITPGTEFMVRLQNALQYFVKCKISSNPLWGKCRIILSGHETPGEGEHKIMEYIRYLKSKTDYDPNTRHCLYGLDADLIILGLCTHELHFSLLREEVKFGRKSKPTSLEETRFFLLHLGLLREYLELEFYALKEKVEDFDIEKIIDDWILMGFLVGNDFIPHLPNLHISSNALPILYKAYVNARPDLAGYINECGVLNLERLEKYFEVLAVSEKECFTELFSDLKYFQAKRSGNGEDYIPEAFGVDIDEIKNSNVDDDLAKLMKDSEMFLGDEFGDDISEDQLIEEEFIAYKNNYYIEKLKYDKMTPEVIEEQTECYIRALQWILYYYYRGVPSWEWFYPHHYAPFASDLKHFQHLKIEFNLGKPFLPFQQLLAVLPAASKDLLPEAFRDLMTSSESGLIEYYPKDFKTDLNGKKQDWEAVVLIPFIDEKKLLKAMEPCLGKLTFEENSRNKHGPMLQYDYSKTSQGSCEGPYSSFKTLYNVFCTEKEIWRDDISVSDNKNISITPKGVYKDIYFPGFPTMKHLKYTGELRNVRVKVFEQPSRNENMIIIPECRMDKTELYIVAQKYLNKEIFIGWPHLIQSKVVAVSTKEKRINANMDEIKQDARLYELRTKAIIEHHMMRMGIDFQDLTVLIHVLPSAGTEYVFSAHGKMTLKKVWSKEEVVYPAQGVVSDISMHNPEFIIHKKVEDIFPVESTVFMLGQPYLGSEGKVLDPFLVYSVGRIKVSLTVLPEPNFTEAKRLQQEIETQYMNSYEASTVLGIQSNCLARITGSIFVIDGIRRVDLPDNTPKINIGLQLKFPKNNEELIGYMRKVGSNWLYSRKAINLVQTYYDRFPKIFELISNCTSKDIYFESDLFPEQVGEGNLRELVTWLKTQEHNKAERVPCGTKTLEKEAVEAVIIATEKLKISPVKCVKLQVKPHLILRPGLKAPEVAKDRKRPLHLFDRIVVIKNTYQVPLGYKGTVVAIHPLMNQNSVRFDNFKDVTYFYDILFDKTLPEGATLHGLAESRVFKISENSILEMCSEDSRKAEVSANDFIANKNKSNASTSKDNTNLTANNMNPVIKNSQETNQLLSAIIRSSVEEKKESDLLSTNNVPDNSNFFIESNKIPKQQKVKENSKFTKYFVKDHSPTQQPFIPILHSPQQSQQQQLQQLQRFSVQPFSNNTKYFELISKQDFLNPPSIFSTKETRKEPPQDNFLNKKQENLNLKASQSLSQSDKFMQRPHQEIRQLKNFDEKQQMPVILNKINVLQKETESVHGTNVLKQILGIDLPTAPNSASNNKKDNNMRQNVPKSLPQPPPNWRIDASIKSATNSENTKLSYFPSTTHQLIFPPPSESSFVGITHKSASTVFNNRNYTTAKIATHVLPYQKHSESQKEKYTSNNTLISANPNGPQSYQSTGNVNADITKGKGAFIPLQALKSVKKAHDTNKSQNYNYKTTKQHGNKILPTNNNIAMLQKETISKKPFTTGKYRAPKIAAKFDHEFLSH